GVFDKILSEWERCMSAHNFDLSYLISIDGRLIMRNKFDEWVNCCSTCDNGSLQIISWKELYPLYEIFDSPLLQKIESIIGINGQSNLRALATGTIPVKNSPFCYRVNFPVRLKSNEYQIFGKFMMKDGKPFITKDRKPIEVILKFKSMDICGFLVFIENLDENVTWILIGIPAKVGYFSTNTQNINILCSGNTSFLPELQDNDSGIAQNSKFIASIILDVPKDLPKDSISITSFKYPPLNYEPNFTANIQSSQNDKIKINIYDNISDEDNEGYESSNSDYKSAIGFDREVENSHNSEVPEGNLIQKLKYSIEWCVLSRGDSSETLVYLDAIGNKVNFHGDKVIFKEDLMKPRKRKKIGDKIDYEINLDNKIDYVIYFHGEMFKDAIKSNEIKKKRKIDDNNVRLCDVADGFQVVGEAAQPFL
ncbi:10691_t:CDS:2, partial [Racocetra persica]